MPTAENTWPKIGGDPLYSSEANDMLKGVFYRKTDSYISSGTSWQIAGSYVIPAGSLSNNAVLEGEIMCIPNTLTFSERIRFSGTLATMNYSGLVINSINQNSVFRWKTLVNGGSRSYAQVQNLVLTQTYATAPTVYSETIANSVYIGSTATVFYEILTSGAAAGAGSVSVYQYLWGTSLY